MLRLPGVGRVSGGNRASERGSRRRAAAVPAAPVSGTQGEDPADCHGVCPVESCHARTRDLMCVMMEDHDAFLFRSEIHETQSIQIQNDPDQARRSRHSGAARRRGGQVRKRRIACKHGLVAAAAGHRDRAGTYHKGSCPKVRLPEASEKATLSGTRAAVRSRYSAAFVIGMDASSFSSASHTFENFTTYARKCKGGTRRGRKNARRLSPGCFHGKITKNTGGQTYV